MKAIILLLVFSSGLFADTIEYQKLFKLTTYDNVKVLGIKGYKVYFQTDEGNIKWVACQLVSKIVDSKNKIINYDCNSNTYHGDEIVNNKSPLVYKIIVTGFITIALILIIKIIAEPDIDIDNLTLIPVG